MAGRRRPATSAKNNEASRRSFAFVIKAASSLLTSFSTYLWMGRTLLPIMRRDAVQMAHLDPTVIIAEPIPIDSLIIFTRNVMITLIITCCVGSTLVGGTTKAQQHAGHRQSIPALMLLSLWNLSQSLVVSVLGIALLVVMVCLAAILCGASPWVDTRHTILASGYVATLAIGPSLIFDARQYLGDISSQTNQIKRLLCGPQSHTNMEVSAPGFGALNNHRQSLCERIDSCAMYGTFVGLIPISILRILDHGDQAQRWPFPMLLGATIGYSAGSVVGILSSCVILLQERGTPTRKGSRPGSVPIFNLLALTNLSAVIVSVCAATPSVSAFHTSLPTLSHNGRHCSSNPPPLPTLYMAPTEFTSTTSKYLDAITEVCDGDMPAKDDCGVAISSYLDALSVGVAESDNAVGSGIASYLDAFTAPSTGPGKHSADAVTSYLGDVSSGVTSPPTRESIVSYLDTLSKVGSEATSDLFIDRTNAQSSFALDATNNASSPKQSGPGSYLDAISEVCEPQKAMEPCLEAVTNYLDALSPNDISQTSHSAKPTSYLDSMAQHSVPSTGSARAASPSMFRQPSEPQDLALESWYKKHAIATGYVQVRTTEESVGGRGMFWSSPEAAKDAQILARIPKRCVLEASSARAKWFEAMNWDHINDKNLAMMAAAMCAYTQSDPTGVDWREWIDTWLGFGGVMPRPLKSYSSEEIQFLASASGSTYADVSVAIELGYNAMKTDAFKLEFPFTDGAKGMTSDIFADMYSVVASRCAVMGPAWDYGYGIIPMHDMHNHPPPLVESSVELHALGDVRPHIEGLDEEVTSLIELSGIADISPPLDDQDILIVARRDIQPGEELYLSYRDASETQGLTSNDRLWLLFQYGFPLVPVE